MDCRACNRLLPSLRICGASATNDSICLKKFSQWETDLLNQAIKDKQKLLKKLRKIVGNRDIQLSIQLSEYDNTKTRDHFGKKLKFYLKQNKTKWRHWPNKYKRRIQANFH